MPLRPPARKAESGGEAVLINPPAERLGTRHAFLWGRGRRHYLADFRGPLSIKAVVAGRAVWETEGRRYEVDPSSFIVVNEDQPYTVSVDGKEPAETFCLFFQHGVVEEIGRVLTIDDASLLDTPEAGHRERAGSVLSHGRLVPGFAFPSFLARDARLLDPLRQAHRMLSRGSAPGPWLEDRILSLGETLIRIGSDARREIARVPAARASTRIELFRRLRRAVDLIEGSLDQPLSLDEVARAACLSPYHFHRLFTETHGETPHHFARRRRLERARERLERSEDSVTDICLDCGFESVTSFSTLFRRRFGLPPARYRRVHRENGKNGEDRTDRSRYLGQEQGGP